MQQNHIASRHAPSGLPTIQSLQWGTHVGHLFGATAELESVLVSYFQAGLHNNERCLWVTTGSFSAATARAALLTAIPDLDTRERNGQIEILEGDAFYAAIENHQADALLDDVLKREEDALAAGYAGLRTNGNCSWCGRAQWNEFQRYEKLLQDNVRDRRMIVMCSYSPECLEPVQSAEVTDRHDFVFRHRPGVNINSNQRQLSAPSAEPDFQTDIETVEARESIPILLRLICAITGMRFSAVARVTNERWVCLAVHDEIEFGLRPGHELNVKTTLCHEVWQSREGIVINHVSTDAIYRGHQTPATYGFESYISMPIFLRDGSLYGTLCAIDPKPAELSTPHMIGMFRAFADLIAFHIDLGGRLARAKQELSDARALEATPDQTAMLQRGSRKRAVSAADPIVGECIAHLSAALTLLDGFDDAAAHLAAAKLSKLSHEFAEAYGARWLEGSNDTK
jgi:GAF domain-containing protein